MSWPRAPKFMLDRGKRIWLEVKYDYSQAKYDLDFPDVYDWNKVCGLATHIFPNHGSVMLAHRARLNDYGFYDHESCIYINTEDGGHFTGEIQPGMIGQCAMFVHKNRIGGSFYIQDQITLELDTRLPFIYRIQPWFGGNQRAPKKVQYDIEWKMYKD